MGLDIKKMLDDINPSNVVLKWIIVILISTTTIIFSWGIKRGKSISELENLNKEYITLLERVNNLEKQLPISIETEIDTETEKVKVVVLKEVKELETKLTNKLKFVVESQGEVTKEWVLKVIDNNNERTQELLSSTIYEYDKGYSSKSLMVSAPVEVLSPIIYTGDTVILENMTYIEDEFTLDEEIVSAKSIEKRSKKHNKFFDFFRNLFKK